MAVALDLPKFKSLFYQFIRRGYHTIMKETPLMDFKMRHLFTARIRIVLFLCTWAAFFLFYPEIWLYSPFVPLVFNLGFLITVYCYWNLLHERYMFRMTILGVVADVLSQTVLVYVIGHDSLAPFLIYGLYVLGAGVLFGYFMSILTAASCFVVYLVLFLFIQVGWIEAFYYPGLGGGLINMNALKGYLTPIFFPFVLILLVYSIRIANYFGRLKQKALERRHVQLAALNNIGSTIRKALNTQEVISQVLRAVTKGLRFETCILALLDEKEQCLKFYVEQGGYYSKKLQEILEIPLDEWRLSASNEPEVLGNAIRRSMDKGRVVIRNHFSDVTLGMTPKMSFDKCVMAQSYLGIKKFVVTPLIAEQKAVGAIIGASISPYIEETVIDTLEHFSNQAALAIESAQLFEELREKNEQLMQANKVKSDFLAIMSHELRTPLFAVIGYSEILLDRILGDMSAEQKKSIVEILRNAKNLLELINNVLDLSKLESGKMDLAFESFDLNQLVEDVYSTLKSLFDKKQQGFEIAKTRSVPQMIGDPVKVRQILINLMGNANKFTDENGRIKITLEYYPKGADITDPLILDRPEFEALLNRPVFYFAVKDDGAGIAADDQAVIFETFRQADNSFTRAHEGTGLGLALTKQLVLLHSGIITVRSELGKGSEFIVVIPQAQVS